MSESEFDEIWQKIIMKWGTKGEWHSGDSPEKAERLEYEHWKRALSGMNKHIVSSALGYYTQHLDNGFWPRLPVMLNCIATVHKAQQSKKNWGKKKDGVPITREFHGKMVELERKIQDGEAMQGFLDNNFEGQGNFTTIKSMAECLVEMYRVHWVNPAMSEHAHKRSQEERKDRSADDLIISQSGKKVCYYCGTPVTRPNVGRYNTDSGISIADYFECHKCDVKFEMNKPKENSKKSSKPEQKVEEDDLPF